MSKYDDIFITDPGYKAIADKADADWQAAYEAGDEEGMARAHKTKEEVRAMYGYSGGEDGSQYIQLEKKQKNEKPSYVSSYDEIMAKAMGQVLNRAPFTYDHEKDPSYQQYADAYTRMGQKAMDDTLGKVSARTGGLASSYATTAAQQTYDGYMAQLTDKVPELRQLAYQMYQDEGAEQRQNLQLLQNLEQIAYGRYRDELDQYNADRDYNYKVGRDAVVDEQWQQEFDTRNNQWQQEWDYTVDQDTRNWARDQIWQSVAELGVSVSGLDPELVTQSGYTEDELARMEKFYLDNQKPKATGAGGGGNPKKPNLTAEQVLDALESGVVNDTTKAAYEYYFGQPWEGDNAEPNPNKTPGTPISEYGPSYSTAWVQARKMFDSGKSEEEIMAYLDTFSEDRLTEEGLAYIMNSLNLGGYRG